jgi:hypothetical protein
MAWQGKACNDMAWLGMTWLGKASNDMAWKLKARQDMAWLGKVCKLFHLYLKCHKQFIGWKETL